jgi:hypothetical protein
VTQLVDQGSGLAAGDFQRVSASGGAPIVLVAEAPGAVFTSRVLESPFDFTHVGVHWKGSPGAGGLAEVRFRRAGEWSAWEELADDPPGDPGVDERFAALVFAGGAQALQYRLSFASAGDRVERVTATVIDSPVSSGPLQTARIEASLEAAANGPFQAIVSGIATDSPRPPTPLPGEPGNGLTLDVVTRQGWGADESIRFRPNGEEIWHEMFVPVKKIMVHHTATRNGYSTAAQAAAEVRAVYAYHAIGRGWGDIGYNAVVDRFGNVYEGRNGRGGDPGDDVKTREVLSAAVSAGHVSKHNYGSAGVALLGDAIQDGWPLTGPLGPMWEGLVRYVSFEARRHSLDLRGAPGVIPATDFLRDDGEWHDELRTLSGHRESQQTWCPGETVLGLLPAVRDAVLGTVDGASRTGVAIITAPGERVWPAGQPMTFSWAAETPEPGWTVAGYDYCLEGWFRPPPEGEIMFDDIEHLSGYSSEKQPRQVWTRVGPETTTVTVNPPVRGAYAFHVRTVVSGAGGLRVAAFAAHRSYWVV